MQRKSASKIQLLLLPLFLVCISLSSPSVYASSSEKSTLKKAPALSHKTYKLLEQAQKLNEEGKIVEAKSKLQEIILNPKRSDYEVAMALRVLAYMQYQASEYDKAIHSYVQIVSKETIPEPLLVESLNALAQLYFLTGNYQASIEYFKRWFSLAKNHSPRSFALFGQAYYQIGEYASAIEPIQTAIKKINAIGQKAKENWYLILRASYFELDRTEDVVDILEKLVIDYPKRKYWVQLAGLYGQLDQPKKQLATMEIAYHQGYLTKSKDVLQLAYLYIGQDIPYKAAKVLEKGLKNGVVEEKDKHLHLLSTAWSTAQEHEKALPALIKAANASTKGNIDSQLARVYFNMEQWEKTTQAIERAYNKGKLKNKPEIDFIYGMALYHQDEIEDALAVFIETKKTQEDPTMVKQWIIHIEKEIERREVLARAAQEVSEQL